MLHYLIAYFWIYLTSSTKQRTQTNIHKRDECGVTNSLINIAKVIYLLMKQMAIFSSHSVNVLSAFNVS